MAINEIDKLGMERVLERGSGEILAKEEDALLVRDLVSGACFLSCEEEKTGLRLFERAGGDCDLLAVLDEKLGEAIFRRFGFSGKMACYQVAYFGEKPSLDDGLTVRAAEKSDLALLAEHYRLISPEELEKTVERGSVLLGYEGDRPVGFAGEHLEGSMGLLFVFPAYRRRGYGAALERRLIARTMEQGCIPFGQVEKDNRASLELQEKLGLTRSENRILWMWRES